MLNARKCGCWCAKGDMCLPLASLDDQAAGDHGTYLVPLSVSQKRESRPWLHIQVCDRNRTRAPSPGCSPRAGAEMCQYFSAFQAPSVCTMMSQRPSCQSALIGPPSFSPQFFLNPEGRGSGIALGQAGTESRSTLGVDGTIMRGGRVWGWLYSHSGP